MKTYVHEDGTVFYRVVALCQSNTGDSCEMCVFDRSRDSCPKHAPGDDTAYPLCIREEFLVPDLRPPHKRIDDIFIEHTDEALAEYMKRRLDDTYHE